MLEVLLARHGAPTLAGLKTGAAFSAAFSGSADLRACFLYWNRRLLPKGLHLLPLADYHGRTLIYLYRRSDLLRDLQHPYVISLLTEYGYPCPDPERCILQLRRRLATDGTFPHELGLFLGYPPEDVLGFLRDPTACRYSGLWKAYGDVAAARSLFARLRACSRTYVQSLSHGIAPDRLAVSG